MVLTALKNLGAKEKVLIEKYSGHRSYVGIKKFIENAPLEENIKKTVLNIYKAIGKAEAKVHGESLETVHFHEVGRNEAIENIIGIASALLELNVREIYCSDIHDGYGKIQCSHGIIPVPVPAVEAMKEQCDYNFVKDNIETEMVTPSGLGILIGIGAVKGEPFEGRTGVGKGSRNIGRDGLKITIV